MNLSANTFFLVYITRMDTALHQVPNQEGTVISEGTRHIMASMIIKAIAKKVKDRNIAKELQWAGKTLFEAGAKAMTYENDDWCATYWPHYFGPHPEPWHWRFGEEIMLNPQPLPPEDGYYGALLTVLADAVSLVKMPDILRNIGYSLKEMKVEKVNT